MWYTPILYLLVFEIALHSMQEHTVHKQRNEEFCIKKCIYSLVTLKNDQIPKQSNNNIPSLAMKAIDKIIINRGIVEQFERYFSLHDRDDASRERYINGLLSKELVLIGNDFLRNNDTPCINPYVAKLIIKNGLKKYILKSKLGTVSVGNDQNAYTQHNSLLLSTSINMNDIKERTDSYKKLYTYHDLEKSVSFFHRFVTCCCALKGMHEQSSLLKLAIHAPIDHFPFASFTTLTSLAIIYGTFHTLPEEFFLLSNVEEIDFSYNEIEKIPSLISKLVALKNAYFSNNKLSKLPAELYQLSKLNSFYVNGNPIIELSNKKDCIFYGISKNQYERLIKGLKTCY